MTKMMIMAAVLCVATRFTRADNSNVEFRQMEARALTGDAKEQYNMGMFYMKRYGEEVGKDSYGCKKYIREALNWFRQAAEKGNVEAEYRIGVCYHILALYEISYRDANVMLKTANEHYRKAAQQGSTNALNRVKDVLRK